MGRASGRGIKGNRATGRGGWQPKEQVTRSAGDGGEPDREGVGHHKPEVAEREVAEHVESFWEPRMLAQIYGYLDEGGTGVDEVARRGLERLRGR